MKSKIFLLLSVYVFAVGSEQNVAEASKSFSNSQLENSSSFLNVLKKESLVHNDDNKFQEFYIVISSFCSLSLCLY